MKKPWQTILFLLIGLYPSALFPSASNRPPVALDRILQACEFLAPGDIPADIPDSQEKTPLYVALDGDDSNSGLLITAPKRHLGAAIEYVNTRPSVPFIIYLREGVYYRSSQYEYQKIERDDLEISSFPGEEVIIRPDFWPADPASWGEEVLFFSDLPLENITISGLILEGWSNPIIFGTQFDDPPLRNLVVRNIRARDFKKRGPNFITTFFGANYVLRDYFSGGDFDPDDPGIKYQIEGLILSNILIEGADMPINIGDENDANVLGLRISAVDARGRWQGSGSTAVDGFAVVNCRYVLIDSCRIENIEGDGIDSKSCNVSVVNTLVSRTGRNAVKFWHDGELINSIIYEADADGALVIEDGPARMIHSILMKKGDGYSGTYGYGASPAAKFEVVNSIFIDLDHSFYLGTPNLTSVNSFYYDLPAGIYSGSVTAGSAAELNALAACWGNSSGDPGIAAPAGGDFHLLPGSAAIDAGTASGFLLPDFDYYGNPRCRGEAPDIGPVETFPTVMGGQTDYDGDGRSDPAVFRPSTGLWAVRGSSRVYFGRSGDIPVPGDYDGDGQAEIAIYRSGPGLWAVRGLSRFYFGGPGWIPIPADYEGDGCLDPAVFHRSAGRWALRGISRFYFGRAGDLVLPGDYRGDGTARPAVFRPPTGLWAIRNESRIYFGGKDGRPVPADYDGDGTDEVAISRPDTGCWSVRGKTRFYFGSAVDRLIPGDYDGDGTDDPAVFRSSSGLWAIRGFSRLYFGAASDLPASR